MVVDGSHLGRGRDGTMTRDTNKKPDKEAKKDEDKKDGDIKEELVCMPTPQALDSVGSAVVSL